MAKLHTKIAHIVSGDLVTKGFGFLLTIYLTRVLGTEGYGMVTIAMAYLGYAVFFGDFGLFNIGVREVAKPKENRIFIPSEILTSRMILATSIFCLVWLTLPYIISESQQLVLTRRYLIAVLIHAYLVEWFFNGIQRYEITAISRSIQAAIYAIGAFIFIDNPSDILKLPILYVIGYLVSAVLLITIALKHKAFSTRNIGLGIYLKLFKSASSVGSGMLFSHFIHLLPPIVIGIFLSTSDAGLYGAAFKLILVGMLIDRLFVQLLIPNLSKYWVEDKERTIVNIEHTSRIMLTIGALISLFTAVGAKDLSNLLFGSEFIESTPIIVALSLYLFITFQNSLFSHGLVAIGQDVQYFKATSYGGAISIVLIVLSSIYFDTIAVGYAVAISELVITCLCFYWFKKSLSFNYIFPFLITMGLGLLTYYGSTFLDIIPLLKAILSILVLGSMLLGFKVLRIDDVKWVKNVLVR